MSGSVEVFLCREGDSRGNGITRATASVTVKRAGRYHGLSNVRIDRAGTKFAVVLPPGDELDDATRDAVATVVLDAWETLRLTISRRKLTHMAALPEPAA